MNTFDFDNLRARWSEQGRALDERLGLDIAAVRARLDRSTASAFRRHRGWLLLGLALAVPMILGLLVFIALHWGQWAWVLMGAALLPLAMSELTVGVAEWRALRNLDFETAAVELQQRLDFLEARRQRQTRAVLSCSVLLWLPLLAVLLKGLFGGDLLHGLHPSVWWVNLGLGLIFIPISLGAAAWWRHHRAVGARFQHIGSGDSWTRARAELTARLSFERAAADDAEVALAAQMLPEVVRVAICALRRRLLLGILICATGLIMIGLFNAVHGGMPQFILPGVLINLALVAQMAPSIQLRLALNAAPGDQTALRVRFESALQLRRRFAVGGVISLPLLLPLLAQVLGSAALGMDLFTMLGAYASGGVLTMAAGVTLALATRMRRSSMVHQCADALSGFSLASGEMLRRRWEGV